MTVIEFAEKRLYECDRDGDDIDLRYWAAYLDGAREQKKEDTAWISVEDGLPDVNTPVVALVESGIPAVAYVSQVIAGEALWCKRDRIWVGDVTHWMPIPKSLEVK